MSYDSPDYVKDLARQMRKEPTPEEALLWEEIRKRKVGVKFRRQHPFGRYIADFYCPQQKLVIEVDGSIHDLPEVMEYDQIRQREIESRGLKVIRIRNEEIREDLFGVIEKILDVIE